MNHKLLQRLLALGLLLCLIFSGCSQLPPKATESTNPPTSQQGQLSPTEPQETLPDGPVTKPVATAPVEVFPTEPEATLPDGPVTRPVETRPDEDIPEQPEEPPTQPEATVPPASSVTKGFKIHFIDVGQADAALVICDGKTMLIDGGNSADSNLIYSFLKARNITHLDYIIATHAHEDHVGGLSGALNYATAGTVYCPVRSYSSKAFNNFASNVQKQGKSITIPTNSTKFSLGSAQCTVLAVNTSSDLNNSSIVLRIVYGSTSFLFTGDAEREVEQAMINRGVPLKSTVLKVGHHGSYTSSSYQFLWNVMPTYAVISCGKDNSYGHPHDEVLSRLRDADVTLFRTDLQGDITCTSNGSSVSFSVSRNWNANVFGNLGGNSTQTPTEPPVTEPPAPQPPVTEPPVTEPPVTEPPVTEPPVTEPPATGETEYILNTNSMKFHDPDCEWAQKISDRNRQDYTGSREDLIEQGYTPCGGCNP